MNSEMHSTVSESFNLIENLPFEVDSGIADRARLGLVLLATDFTIEHEWRAIISRIPGVALYQTRISCDWHITPENLRAMEPKIAAAAGLILPGASLDVVAFGCTSASMAIGEDKVFAQIHSARPDAMCSTPITAAFAAFRALDARRIAVLTPYRSDVNRIMAQYIQKRGFAIPVFGSFNEKDDRIVSRITLESVRGGIRRVLEKERVDAVFVSCTSIRLVEAVREIEQEVGLPVTSSNHAMAWHSLRLAGVSDCFPAWGKLFEAQLTMMEGV